MNDRAHRPAIAFELNGRRYGYPAHPTVVICVDGCEPDYLDRARSAGLLPSLSRAMSEGYAGLAAAVMPTFTNPNNISIVTGAPPSVHGISGNYYLDRATGREIMMTDASLLRSETLLGKFSQAGVATAAVTAKDKLRKALGHGLKGIAFSSERAGDCTLAENGIEGVEDFVGRRAPDTYSADLSLFVLDAGIRLLETRRAELLYLSLSDYVQHKSAPGTAEADAFYAQLDARVGRLMALGATVALTADHGMNDKALPNGDPNVVYLEDAIAGRFGPGLARVICPITDPYVRHHGALGSFARVYVSDKASLDEIARFIGEIAGIELVLSRDDACARFELPPDCEGDLAVVAARGAVIGAKRSDHDLSALGGARLRSHGGLSEQQVPFIVSRRLTRGYAERAAASLRNFDIFDFAINGVA